MDKPEYIANIIGFVDKYLLHTLHRYHAAAIIASMLFVLTGSLLIAVYYAVKNAHGYITTGRVLGVVVNSDYSAKNKEKKNEYRLVLEYPSVNGKWKKSVCSEYHDKYRRYRTGESVSLKIVPNQIFDDVYVKDESVSLKLGVFILMAGLLGALVLIEELYWFYIVLLVPVIFGGGGYFFIHRVKPVAPASGSIQDIEGKRIVPMEEIT